MASVNMSARNLARFTANPVTMKAALVHGDLDAEVALNPNLTEDLWWEIYSRKKVPAQVAVNLCTRELNREQLEHVYSKERRITVRETALQRNGVPEDMTDAVVGAKWFTAQSARSWLYSGTIAPRALPHVAVFSGKPELGFGVVNKHPESYSDDTVVDLLFDVYCNEFRAFGLPSQVLTTFDQRPAVTVRTLERILQDGVQFKHRALAWAAAECRWQTPQVLDLLVDVISALGEVNTDDSRVSWAPRLVNDLVKSVWGHPNTPLERLDEFAGFFNESAEVPGDTTMRSLRHVRESCAEPVTGDWGSQLPAAQEHTLLMLARRGLKSGSSWHPRAVVDPSMRSIPRVVPTYASYEDAWRQCPADGSAQVGTRRQGFASSWPTGPSALAAKYLDEELRDASQSVWETVFSLLPNWTPTAAELATAARALDD